MRNRPRLGSIYRRRKRMRDGSVVELPNWWIKYSNGNGRIFRESSRSSRIQEAEKLLKQRIQQIEDRLFAGPKYDRILIGELLDELILDYRVNGKSLKDFADPIVRCHLRPYFGRMRATSFTTPDVQKYMAERRDAGAANATINRECALLRRAFNLGRRQTPPKVRFVPYIPKLKEDNVRKGFLEHSQFVDLRQALPDEIKPVLTFAYYTGCRREEILSLAWSQVDLVRKIVRLEPGTTKNDEGRNLPLVPELFETLSMQKSIRDVKYPHCSWVFFRRGKRIRDFRGAWEIACKAAKLVDAEGNPNRIFHDLRRTGVRNLIRAGIPERVAMLISGHKSRSVFERYNIVSERDLQEAARRLENYISQMAGAESRNTLGTLLGTPAKPSGQTGEDKLLITTVVRHCAKVAELADAPDLGSGPARGRGSTPLFRTNTLQALTQAVYQFRQDLGNFSLLHGCRRI
jgi:integrase